MESEDHLKIESNSSDVSDERELDLSTMFPPNLTVTLLGFKSADVAGPLRLQISVNGYKQQCEKFETMPGVKKSLEDEEMFYYIDWKSVDGKMPELEVKLMIRNNPIGGGKFKLEKFYKSEQNNISVELEILAHPRYQKVIGTFRFQVEKWDKKFYQRQAEQIRERVNQFMMANPGRIMDGHRNALSQINDISSKFPDVVNLRTIKMLADDLEEKASFLMNIPLAGDQEVSESQAESEAGVEDEGGEKSNDERQRRREQAAAFSTTAAGETWAVLAESEWQVTYEKVKHAKKLLAQIAKRRPVIAEKLAKASNTVQNESYAFVASAKICAKRGYSAEEDAAQEALKGCIKNYEMCVESCKMVRRTLKSAYVLTDREPNKAVQETSYHRILAHARRQIILHTVRGYDGVPPRHAGLVREYEPSLEEASCPNPDEVDVSQSASIEHYVSITPGPTPTLSKDDSSHKSGTTSI